ncbi:MAG: hypothetical protein K6T27_06060 [Thermoleophilum sp.]|nr:hypothetical protein [Thermoleophilum sp.]
MRATNYAVVGHVEWCDFVRVEQLPLSGEIVHADAHFAEPAGGGAVAAVELARLAGDALFFTALGDDELGARARQRLGELGVTVFASEQRLPQRRALVFLEQGGERTITVLGSRLGPAGAEPLPWQRLAGAAVYFAAGDRAALERARQGRVLVATARALDVLRGSGVAVDVLVRSGRDRGERYEPGWLEPPPRVVVTTLGRDGGYAELAGGGRLEWRAETVADDEVADTYGAGDCFAAGLTWALGSGRELAEALAVAAHCGAACVRRQGPYGSQIAG